eukprot:CAMPEP_0116032528 /NCGR_PEP_ID=MMETSP0321-20121206/18226_1 /TAXON_ID=163516 /ORGANISM="Leptocylindrus danicus var. danicus, Strain B650" /LENGTH=115 /DNA_ID=CAMNT_0003507987 /DNA_START=53 /DNA_END=400 /DNA_ORIENTATION=+
MASIARIAARQCTRKVRLQASGGVSGFSTVPAPLETTVSHEEAASPAPLFEEQRKNIKTDDLVLGGKLAIQNPYARGGGGCNICGRELEDSCDICSDGSTRVEAFIKEIDMPKPQ